MNPELITELKQRYREFLSTSTGISLLQTAIHRKKEWMESEKEPNNICVKTTGVVLDKIRDELRHKITLLEIIPIGVNNQCHKNSGILSDKKLGISSVLGFNLCACPCGRYMCYEIHSVNKVNGKLVDFTRDYDNQPTKYFLELNTTLSPNKYVSIFGDEPYYIDKGCKCNVRWNPSPLVKDVTEREFAKFIQTVEAF